MKALWRLLVAVGVLAAVMAVLYWPRKKTEPASAHPLLTFAAGTAERLQVSQPGKPAVVAVNKGGRWSLQEPYEAAADPAVIKGVLGTLNDITGAQKLGKETNLSAFGLDQPSTVEIALQGGKSLQFQFGGTAPTSDNVYLKVSTIPGVVMVPGYVKDDAVKSAFALQDKSLVHFSESAVTGVVLRDRGKTIAVRKVKGAWPKAQKSNVQTLLDALADGEMDSVADPTGSDAGRYGLASPLKWVRLEWKGGQARLDIGQKKDTQYYARNSSSPAIFLMSSYIVDDVNTLAQPPRPAAKAKK